MAPSDSSQEPKDVGPQTPRPSFYRNPRFLWWTGGVVSSLVLALILIVFVLPTPVARYVLVSELEKLGIENTGIETVRFNLWNSAIEAGPIDLWSNGSDPGRMQSVALVYDFDSLFNEELLLETFVIEGVDIFVQRDEEGAFTINGISLAKFMEQNQVPEGADEEDDGTWGSGVTELRIRNSRLRLQDYTGGILALEIDELVLKDLNSWAPNEGGAFEFKMALNDIGLEFEGKILPFADPIHLSLQGGLRDATLSKISKFTGPLGLDRQEGVLDSDLTRDMYFHSDGRVEEITEGTITITGVDVVSEDKDQVQFENAEIEIDTTSTIFADDSFEYAGTIKGALEMLAVGSSNGSKGSAEKITLAIEDFTVAQRNERRETADDGAGPPTATPKTDGPAPSLISQIVLSLVEIVREVLSRHLEFEATPSTTIDGISIFLAAENGEPSVDLSTASLVASAPGVRASTVDEGWRIDGSLNGTITQSRSTVDHDDAVVTSAVEKIDLAAPRIDAQTGEVDTVISFDVRSTFEDFVTSKTAAGGAEAFDLAFGALAADTSGFKIRSGPEGQRAAGPIDMKVDAFQATVQHPDGTGKIGLSGMVVALPSLEIGSTTTARNVELSGHTEVLSLAASRVGVGGEQDLRIGTASWKTDIARLDLDVRDEGALVAGEFDTDLSTVEAEFGPGKASISSWQAAVGNLTVDTRNEALAVKGDLATNLAGVQSEVMVDATPLDLALGGLKAELTSLDIVSKGDELSLGLAGHSTLENLDTSLAASETRPGAKAALDLLSVDLQELAFSSGATPAWRGRADLGMANLNAQTSEETLFTLAVGQLEAKGLESDDTRRFNVDELDLSALSIAFSDQTIALLTDDGSVEDAETPPASEDQAALPKLRAGRLAIGEGSKIQFTDTSVEPIARFVTAIKKATVENFDTEAPSENTTIDFQAELNELSEISLSGSMAPLKDPIGLDMVGQVKDVTLPDFSPYIAKFTGMNIETGQLTSNLAALTDASDLKGKVDVLISELDLSSATDESSEKFQSDYGVPIELAVGLLEDNEGKIALEFPIGGKVDAPKIDYRPVIVAALKGVLTAFFPSFDFVTKTGGVRLDPIVFSAGASELDDVGRGLSEKIAKLLDEKPKLSIKVCGKATKADFIAAQGDSEQEEASDEERQTGEEQQPEAWISTIDKHIAAEEVILSEAQAERLLGIAIERTSATRRYLIESAGISAERVGQCRISYSLKDDKPPRVDVRF